MSGCNGRRGEPFKPLTEKPAIPSLAPRRQPASGGTMMTLRPTRVLQLGVVLALLAALIAPASTVGVNAADQPTDSTYESAPLETTCVNGSGGSGPVAAGQLVKCTLTANVSIP